MAKIGRFGGLYIVATPIGNLEDMTIRASRILRDADLIVCEDTRVTGHLLRHLDIRDKRMLSMNARNEHARVAEIVDQLLNGTTVAMVSDAGTPGMSDPGTALVAATIAAGVRVESIPGPNAAVTAVVASGLPTRSVLFEGFLPHKKGRQTRLLELAEYTETIVLYESPHRILRTLRDICNVFGDERRAAIGRELTKLYEEYNRGTVSELLAEYEGRVSIKGEFVLMVAGCDKRRGAKKQKNEDLRL